MGVSVSSVRLRVWSSHTHLRYHHAPSAEADAVVAEGFEDDDCAIDELSEAALRDNRGFCGLMLRDS